MSTDELTSLSKELRMANEQHLKILSEGVQAWNAWRRQHPDVRPDLRGLDFRAAGLPLTYMNDCPNLGNVDLSNADLQSCSLRNAEALEANFDGASLAFSDLCFATFRDCSFRRASLRVSKIGSAHLVNCDFTGADLAYCSAEETNFSGSRFVMTDLSNMTFVKSVLKGASLDACHVYGISTWDLVLEGCSQTDLVVSPAHVPAVTVDDLEIAQFLYLISNSAKIRNAIETITSKMVLILGSFRPDRKLALDVLKDALRARAWLPVVFDFDKPESRSFVETVSTLAHLSRFVIADFTDPADVLREVPHIVAALTQTPVVPLLKADRKEVPVALQDLGPRRAVTDLVVYRDELDLKERVIELVLDAAEAKLDELRVAARRFGPRIST